MAKPGGTTTAGHSARLTPLERAFIEVMRRRDPARRWAPKPSRGRKRSDVRAEDDPEALADRVLALLLGRVAAEAAAG